MLVLSDKKMQESCAKDDRSLGSVITVDSVTFFLAHETIIRKVCCHPGCVPKVILKEIDHNIADLSKYLSMEHALMVNTQCIPVSKQFLLTIFLMPAMLTIIPFNVLFPHSVVEQQTSCYKLVSWLMLNG